MEEKVLAYAAGIVDGEGCITIQRSGERRHCMSVFIANTNRRLLEWLVFHFGGRICIHRASNGCKPSYAWKLNGEKASDFLVLVKPYLVLKCEQVDLALDFQTGVSICGWKRLSDAEIAMRESQTVLMNGLNKRGQELQIQLKNT